MNEIVISNSLDCQVMPNKYYFQFNYIPAKPCVTINNKPKQNIMKAAVE